MFTIGRSSRTRWGVVLLALQACASESAVDSDLEGTDGDSTAAGGSSSTLTSGGSSSTDDPSGASLTSQGGTNQTGGAAGSDSQSAAGTGGAGSGEGGSDQGGNGGAGGSDSSQGGTDSGGTGGVSGSAGQAGSAGSAGQGGTGGTAGTSGTAGSTSDPTPPACTFSGFRCTGLLFEFCILDGNGVAQYGSSQCGLDADVGLNCDSETGCYGECVNGDVRCTGELAEACVDGSWQTTEECGFQCVDGACEGACTPGSVACDGLSRVTCGEDFRYGSPEACPTDPNATTSCTGAGLCGLEPIACTGGTADCDGNWSCETDLSSPDSCGGCGIVCPGATNATRTCNGGVCGLSPNACSEGTANCTGDFVCETPTLEDPLNCGGCGVSCYGGTCSNGQCSNDFEVVADLTGVQGEPQGLTIDGGYAYWFDVSVATYPIRRTLVDGSGPVETVANTDSPSFPFQLKINSGFIYYVRANANNNLGGIYRAPVTGGTPTKLTGLDTLLKPLQLSKTLEITIVDGFIYWTDANVSSMNDLCYIDYVYGNGHTRPCAGSVVIAYDPNYLTNYPAPTAHIYKMPVAGGSPTVVMTLPALQEYDSHIEIVGNQVILIQYLYFTDQTYGNRYDSRLTTYDLGTGQFVKFYSNSEQTYLNELALSSTHATFWTDQPASNRCLTVIPFTGSAGFSGASGYTCLTEDLTGALYAIDSAYVYYRAQTGNLSRIPVEGGTIEAVAPTIQAPRSATLDVGYVYWTVDVYGTGEKAILRVAK